MNALNLSNARLYGGHEIDSFYVADVVNPILADRHHLVYLVLNNNWRRRSQIQHSQACLPTTAGVVGF